MITIQRPDERVVNIGAPVSITQPRATGAEVGTYLLQAITTAPGQTVTIHRLTPTGSNMTVYWGDGNTTLVTAGSTAAISNTYATAATYDIRVSDATLITQVDFHDARLWNFDTATLYGNVVTHFSCYSVGGGFVIDSADMTAWRPSSWYLLSMPAGTYTIDSADMTAWRPSYWQLYSMPAGTYTIDSADMTAWRPVSWYLHSMPAGTYTIDSADMTAWRPSSWYLLSMPAGTYTIDSADMTAWRPSYWYLYSMPGTPLTISSANDFDGWVSCSNFRSDSTGLLTADVDAILESFYNAFPSRTVSGGAINVGGTNQDPSGTYQAMCPPVDGKEYAYELINDTCGVSARHWTTITY